MEFTSSVTQNDQRAVILQTREVQLQMVFTPLVLSTQRACQIDLTYVGLICTHEKKMAQAGGIFTVPIQMYPDREAILDFTLVQFRGAVLQS